MCAILNSFLYRINYSNVYQLPYNNDPQSLAVQDRNSRITGKDLIKQNVEREAHRLQLYCSHTINLATDYIWISHSTSSQRNHFINLANNANNANKINQNYISKINNDTIDRIARMNVPQITNNCFENDIFNGVTNFDNNNNNNNNNSFESLILPAGYIGSSFP